MPELSQIMPEMTIKRVLRPIPYTFYLYYSNNLKIISLPPVNTLLIEDLPYIRRRRGELPQSQ